MHLKVFQYSGRRWWDLPVSEDELVQIMLTEYPAVIPSLPREQAIKTKVMVKFLRAAQTNVEPFDISTIFPDAEEEFDLLVKDEHLTEEQHRILKHAIYHSQDRKQVPLAKILKIKADALNEFILGTYESRHSGFKKGLQSIENELRELGADAITIKEFSLSGKFAVKEQALGRSFQVNLAKAGCSESVTIG